MTVQFDLGGSGNPEAGLLGTGLPLLAGDRSEPLGQAAGGPERSGGLWVWRVASGLVGYAEVEAAADLETATRNTYAEIMRTAGHLNLYRLWNFVPDINGSGSDGLENYRSFCLGRSMAFEAALGQGFTRLLPAASAVGSSDSRLRVAFLAGEHPVRNFENPKQVPAYEYPQEYGPRSPSFSRATVVLGAGTLDGYVSGTSAVVGHATVAPGDTAAQLASTFDNLRLISRASGLGDALGSGATCRRHFKVYLRSADDLTRASEALAGQQIVGPGDRVSYLRAAICRSALNVEIEVAVRGAESA